jgi:hypothetical protein
LTEQSVLAGVRIETGDGDPRGCISESRQFARRQSDCRLHRLGRQCLRHFGQWDVHRRQDDAQCFGVKHHRHGGNTRQVSEQIRMAVPWKAGQSERLFVDWSRRYRSNTVLPRIFHRTNDGFIRCAASVGAQQPRFE